MQRMNTNDFESNVKTIINALGFNAYQNKAPNKAVMPYVVFRFDTVLDTSPTYLINAVFACYDSQDVSSKSNKIRADLIQRAFNKTSLNFDDMSIHSIMTLRQDIPSEMLEERQVIELQFDMTLYL